MKKNFLAVLTLVLMLALLLSSCGEKAVDDESGKSNEKMTLSEIADIEKYKIVRPDKCTENEKSIFVNLRKMFKEKLGIDIAAGTDFDGEVSREILLGHTSRDASKAAENEVARHSDFIIKTDGSKIVIMGGSEEALGNAVNFWFANMINASGKLCAPKDGQQYKNTKVTALDSLSVDGVDISEFDIVYAPKDALGKEIAEKIQVFVKENDDAVLEVRNTDGVKHKIDVGASADATSSIEVKDGNIYVRASYYHGSDWVIAKLSEMVKNATDKKFNITSANNISEKKDVSIKYSKEDLMNVLEKVYNSDQVIVGEEMPFYAEMVNSTLDSFFEASGQYPGILGLDIRQANLASVGAAGRARIAAELAAYAEKGGIVTASAHFANPLNGNPDVESYRGSLGGDDKWAELVTDGTELNASFKKELDGIADFLGMLKEYGVPVIWRPLHEMNGSWFWFCTGQIDQNGKEFRISSESIVNLWKYIYNYFTEERGLDNLLWEYSPNISNDADGGGSALYAYPGGDYVDLVGMDWYSDGDFSIFENTPTYSDLLATGKIVSLAEFGPSGEAYADKVEDQPNCFSCRDLPGYIDNLRLDNYKIAYILTWTPPINLVSLGYTDEFMAHNLTLGQSDVKAMFDAIK